MINISLCTISFRHQLISLPEIAHWASTNNFQGIELWGAHARNLDEQDRLNAAWLRNYGLRITMLSDYLPMEGDPEPALRYCNSLCELAQHWQTTKLRTFAGKRASADTDAKTHKSLVTRLREYCDLLKPQGIDLLIETHPNTYADNSSATLQLIEEAACENLKINFDVLHVWEANECPVTAWYKLAPHIRHMHLKNIRARKYLSVFEPGNIYAAAGSRAGIVPTFEGVFDYEDFFARLPSDPNHNVSLEWFGSPVREVLRRDARRLSALFEDDPTHSDNLEEALTRQALFYPHN